MTLETRIAHMSHWYHIPLVPDVGIIHTGDTSHFLTGKCSCSLPPLSFSPFLCLSIQMMLMVSFQGMVLLWTLCQPLRYLLDFPNPLAEDRDQLFLLV